MALHLLFNILGASISRAWQQTGLGGQHLKGTKLRFTATRWVLFGRERERACKHERERE